MSLNSRFNENVKIVINYLINSNGIEPRKNEVYEGIYPSKIITKIRNIYYNGEEMEDGSIIYDDWILDKTSIDELNKINFNFNRPTSIDKFNYNLDVLKEYLTTNDMISIKKNTMYKNFNLGEWVSFLRVIYKDGKKRNNGSIVYLTENSKRILTKYEIDELNKIGFIWNTNSYNITTRGEYLEKRRILHIKLGKILQDCKNQINNKKDVERINKKLMKKLD